MLVVTGIHKKIAKHTASAMDANVQGVSSYWDEAETSSVYIMRIDDRPQLGVSAYATIGLSDHPLFYNGVGFGTRAELVGACASNTSGFDEVLATLSFCVINSHWFCAPGRIFPDVVSMHGISSSLTDIYFASPFLWGDRLRSVEMDGRLVAWLQAVPISRKERDFADNCGSDKLEDLFVEANIDIYDINRPSVV